MRSKLGTKSRLAAHITALVLLILMLAYLAPDGTARVPAPFPPSEAQTAAVAAITEPAAPPLAHAEPISAPVAERPASTDSAMARRPSAPDAAQSDKGDTEPDTVPATQPVVDMDPQAPAPNPEPPPSEMIAPPGESAEPEEPPGEPMPPEGVVTPPPPAEEPKQTRPEPAPEEPATKESADPGEAQTIVSMPPAETEPPRREEPVESIELEAFIPPAEEKAGPAILTEPPAEEKVESAAPAEPADMREAVQPGEREVVEKSEEDTGVPADAKDGTRDSVDAHEEKPAEESGETVVRPETEPDADAPGAEPPPSGEKQPGDDAAAPDPSRETGETPTVAQPDESGELVVAESDAGARSPVPALAPLPPDANLEVLADGVYWLNSRHALEAELAAIPELGTLILLAPVPGYMAPNIGVVRTIVIPAAPADLTGDSAEHFMHLTGASAKPIVAAAIPGAGGAAFFKGAFLLSDRHLSFDDMLRETELDLEEAGQAREEIIHRLRRIDRNGDPGR